MKKNCLPTLVPRCGHSLNLVKNAAAYSSEPDVQFLVYVQSLTTFYTAPIDGFRIITQKRSIFTSWKRLVTLGGFDELKLQKRFNNVYSEIKQALSSPFSDKEDKDIVKNDATNLSEKMSSFETV